jgi:hypothetical protein
MSSETGRFGAAWTIPLNEVDELVLTANLGAKYSFIKNAKVVHKLYAHHRSGKQCLWC